MGVCAIRCICRYCELLACRHQHTGHGSVCVGSLLLLPLLTFATRQGVSYFGGEASFFQGRLLVEPELDFGVGKHYSPPPPPCQRHRSPEMPIFKRTLPGSGPAGPKTDPSLSWGCAPLPLLSHPFRNFPPCEVATMFCPNGLV